MILPPNYAVALALLIFGALCLGGWVNTFKIGAKWRYELYYLDFSLGVVVTALILAFTLGSLGYDGFTLADDVMHAGKNQWLMAFIAGGFVSSGVMLTLAAASTGGLAVGFGCSLGVWLVVGTLMSRAFQPAGGESTLQFAGAALGLTGMLVAAACYRMVAVGRHEDLARAGKAKSTKRPAPIKAAVLGSVGGVLLGVFPQFVNNARATEVGLGPYALMVFASFGGLLSTLVLSLFLMNLPVEGEPVDVFDYAKGGIGTHLRGAIGGMVFALGLVSLLVVGAGGDNFKMPPAIYNAFFQGWPILAALCGVAIWGELRGADGRVKVLALLMFLLLGGGLGLASMALLLPSKAV